jgi:ElaB/YqjD/DUF883 family membrane-anchored ribosome-binding protein
MHNEPEVIREQMRETQADLCEKLGALEDRVFHTMHEAKAVVRRTTETVTDKVQEIKDTLDVRPYIRAHPWLAAAGALAAGYLVSRMIRREPLLPGQSGKWFSEMFQRYLLEVKPLAIGASFSLARDALAPAVPPEFRSGFTAILDGLVRGIGGHVVRTRARTQVACAPASLPAM